MVHLGLFRDYQKTPVGIDSGWLGAAVDGLQYRR